MKNTNFFKSAKCALNGFIIAIKSERNLRFDVSVMLTVIFFALCYGISRFEWAVITVIFAAVIGAELFNSALERAVDLAEEDYNEIAGAAKDISAAAVFVCAICAIVSGIFIFGDIERIWKTLIRIFTNPAYALIFLILIASDIILIFKKEKGVK